MTHYEPDLRCITCRRDLSDRDYHVVHSEGYPYYFCPICYLEKVAEEKRREEIQKKRFTWLGL